MKKNNKIVCLWIILLAFNSPLISKDLEVKCKAELSNDSLKVKFEIRNISLKEFYFQNQFWDFGGSETTNRFFGYAGRGYIVNSIFMIPADSSGVSYRTEKLDYPHLDIIDNPIILRKNNKVSITVLLKYEKTTRNKIKVFIKLPYFFDPKLINLNNIKSANNNVTVDLFSKVYSNGSNEIILYENDTYENYLKIEDHDGDINDRISGYYTFSCIVKEKKCKKANR